MELLLPKQSPSNEDLDSKIASAPLYACTKCMKKFPFASLSEDKQCCPSCRAASISVKCIYCQTEFEDSGSSSLCRNCLKNEKHFGKPKACEWCNMIAAFNKSTICTRCKHYSSKYGNPLPCERCKRECGFDRKDDKKIGNRILCWSCLQSYRRKKSGTDDINGNRKRSMLEESGKVHSHSQTKSLKTIDLIKTEATRSHESTPEKTPINSSSRMNSSSCISNGISSSSSRDVLPRDNFMLISELRDKVASLEKQLIGKDSQIASRDRQIADLKTEISISEQHSKSRVQSLQRTNSEYVEQLANKSREISQLQKQLNSIRKEKGRGGEGSKGSSNNSTSANSSLVIAT